MHKLIFVALSGRTGPERYEWCSSCGTLVFNGKEWHVPGRGVVYSEPPCLGRGEDRDIYLKDLGRSFPKTAKVFEELLGRKK